MSRVHRAEGEYLHLLIDEEWIDEEDGNLSTLALLENLVDDGIAQPSCAEIRNGGLEDGLKENSEVEEDLMDLDGVEEDGAGKDLAGGSTGEVEEMKGDDAEQEETRQYKSDRGQEKASVSHAPPDDSFHGNANDTPEDSDKYPRAVMKATMEKPPSVSPARRSRRTSSGRNGTPSRSLRGRRGGEECSLSDMMAAGVLEPLMELHFMGDCGILTGDGWIEYQRDKYPDIEVWAKEVARQCKRKDDYRSIANIWDNVTICGPDSANGDEGSTGSQKPAHTLAEARKAFEGGLSAPPKQNSPPKVLKTTYASPSPKLVDTSVVEGSMKSHERKADRSKSASPGSHWKGDGEAKEMWPERKRKRASPLGASTMEIPQKKQRQDHSTQNHSKLDNHSTQDHSKQDHSKQDHSKKQDLSKQDLSKQDLSKQDLSEQDQWVAEEYAKPSAAVGEEMINHSQGHSHQNRTMCGASAEPQCAALDSHLADVKEKLRSALQSAIPIQKQHKICNAEGDAPAKESLVEDQLRTARQLVTTFAKLRKRKREPLPEKLRQIFSALVPVVRDNNCHMPHFSTAHSSGAAAGPIKGISVRKEEDSWTTSRDNVSDLFRVNDEVLPS